MVLQFFYTIFIQHNFNFNWFSCKKSLIKINVFFHIGRKTCWWEGGKWTWPKSSPEWTFFFNVTNHGLDRVMQSVTMYTSCSKLVTLTHRRRTEKLQTSSGCRGNNAILCYCFRWCTSGSYIGGKISRQKYGRVWAAARAHVLHKVTLGACADQTDGMSRIMFMQMNGCPLPRDRPRTTTRGRRRGEVRLLIRNETV